MEGSGFGSMGWWGGGQGAGDMTYGGLRVWAAQGGGGGVQGGWRYGIWGFRVWRGGGGGIKGDGLPMLPPVICACAG